MRASGHEGLWSAGCTVSSARAGNSSQAMRPPCGSSERTPAWPDARPRQATAGQNASSPTARPCVASQVPVMRWGQGGRSQGRTLVTAAGGQGTSLCRP
jgi:hypothetical protein